MDILDILRDPDLIAHKRMLLPAAVNDAADEIERLREENGRLTVLLSANEKQECDEIERLRAELDMMRADAERYRWLRANMTYCASDRSPTLSAFASRIWYHATDATDYATLDATIDAALRG